MYFSFWFLVKILAFKTFKEIRLLFFIFKLVSVQWSFIRFGLLTSIAIFRYAPSWWRTLKKYWREVIGLSSLLTKLQQCKTAHFTLGNSLSVFIERFGWKMLSYCKSFGFLLLFSSLGKLIKTCSRLPLILEPIWLFAHFKSTKQKF